MECRRGDEWSEAHSYISTLTLIFPIKLWQDAFGLVALILEFKEFTGSGAGVAHTPPPTLHTHRPPSGLFGRPTLFRFWSPRLSYLQIWVLIGRVYTRAFLSSQHSCCFATGSTLPCHHCLSHSFFFLQLCISDLTPCRQSG